MELLRVRGDSAPSRDLPRSARRALDLLSIAIPAQELRSPSALARFAPTPSATIGTRRRCVARARHSTLARRTLATAGGRRLALTARTRASCVGRPRCDAPTLPSDRPHRGPTWARRPGTAAALRRHAARVVVELIDRPPTEATVQARAGAEGVCGVIQRVLQQPGRSHGERRRAGASALALATYKLPRTARRPARRAALPPAGRQSVFETSGARFAWRSARQAARGSVHRRRARRVEPQDRRARHAGRSGANRTNRRTRGAQRLVRLQKCTATCVSADAPTASAPRRRAIARSEIERPMHHAMGVRR